ncbi:MAG TPA: glycosyltransferase [Firmicutes bacterium]|nr:glycosyltransferase [Bacillota bacterium]
MHQMTLRLAEKNRVLYIGRQFSIEHLIKHPQYFKFIFNAVKGIYKLKENLFVKAPFLLLPGRYYVKWIDSLNQWMMKNRIKRWAKKLGFKEPVIWCFFPNSGRLVARLNESLFFYHCCEAFSAGSSGRKEKIIDEIESELVKKSDLVVCTSKKIFEDKLPDNKNCFFFPNAAETSLFQKVIDERMPESELVKNIPFPRLIHIGFFNAKVDIKLLLYLFSKHKDWHFIHVGEIMESDFKPGELRRLKQLSNIKFIKQVPQTKVPEFIKPADFCIIPLKKNKWTEYVRPLKLFEFIATGKPVIATDTYELKDYKDLIFLAETETDYERIISDLISRKITNDPQKQISFALQNTWDKRYLEIISRLQDFL